MAVIEVQVDDIVGGKGTFKGHADPFQVTVKDHSSTSIIISYQFLPLQQGTLKLTATTSGHHPTSTPGFSVLDSTGNIVLKGSLSFTTDV